MTSFPGNSVIQCAQLLRTLIILRTVSRSCDGRNMTVCRLYHDLFAILNNAARSKSESLEYPFSMAISCCVNVKLVLTHSSHQLSVTIGNSVLSQFNMVFDASCKKKFILLMIIWVSILSTPS